jgi:hypothetical protein
VSVLSEERAAAPPAGPHGPPAQGGQDQVEAEAEFRPAVPERKRDEPEDDHDGGADERLALDLGGK